jgi:ATP-dependent DNA ligase
MPSHRTVNGGLRERRKPSAKGFIAGLAARNQVRRLPHACAARSRCGEVADAHRLDWTRKYPALAAAVSSLGARQAYLDGELCGVFPDGITSASDFERLAFSVQSGSNLVAGSTAC